MRPFVRLHTLIMTQVWGLVSDLVCGLVSDLVCSLIDYYIIYLFIMFYYWIWIMFVTLNTSRTQLRNQVHTNCCFCQPGGPDPPACPPLCECVPDGDKWPAELLVCCWSWSPLTLPLDLWTFNTSEGPQGTTHSRAGLQPGDGGAVCCCGGVVMTTGPVPAQLLLFFDFIKPLSSSDQNHFYIKSKVFKSF